MRRRPSRLELPADNDAVERHRDWLDRYEAAELIGDAIDDQPDDRGFDGLLLVEKGDFAQHRVFWRGLRRGVDDPDIIAELAYDPGQDPGVGGNPGSLGKRKVEAVIKNAAAIRSTIGHLALLHRRRTFFSGSRAAVAVACCAGRFRLARR